MRKLIVLLAFAFATQVQAQGNTPAPVPTPVPLPQNPVQNLNKVTPNLVNPNLQHAIQNAMAGSADAQAANEPPLPPVTGKDGLIAKVNGVNIPLKSFSEKYDRFVEGFEARKQKVPNRIALRYRESIIKRLIEEELIRQEAEKQKVVANPAKIEEEFVKYKEMFKSEERFARYLESSKTSVEQIKENIVANLKFQELIKNRASITEKEIEEDYKNNIKRYEQQEQVRASQILIKVPKDATPEVNAAATKRAEDAIKEIKAGLSFDEAVKKYSEGANKDKGGDLNFFARGRLPKAIEEKAFTMKINEITDAIKTEVGLHILKVTERKEAKVRPLEEVKESIKAMLENRALREARSQLINQLTQSAKVERFLPEYKEEGPTAGQPAIDLKKIDPPAPK